MKENKTTANCGVSFTSLLTIVFITLKLLGVISWSWLWVLSPLLISFAIVLVILLVFVVLSVIEVCNK